MRLKYVGGHDEVEIDETGQVCKHGDTLEVDDALGKSLLDQPSNWEAVKATTTKPKKETD